MTLCFAVYLAAVFWYTIGKRHVGYYPSRFDLFWSYGQWLNGKKELGLPIVANIAMFVPFGFLSAALWHGTRRKAFRIALITLVFSVLIETAQLFLMRGMFEFDDICNNVLGALAGIAAFQMMKRFLPDQLKKALLYAAGACILLFSVAVFFLTDDEDQGAMTPLPQGLCFQVEHAAYADGTLEMEGVCFWYHQGPESCTLVLQSPQTGKRQRLRTDCGISRPEVSSYFRLENINAGFQAAGPVSAAGEEYEILLDYGFFRTVPTGVYLTIGPENTDPAHAARQVSVHYVSTAAFPPLESENTDLAPIAARGVLCACNPAHHAYVYWYENRLYWIADTGFFFEDDGSTRLELMLWTTEPEKLPEKSREKGRQYELTGVYFEKNELTGDFGRYRVCARELPAEYAITAISTGYYAKGWIWRESFWPIFDFSR